MTPKDSAVWQQMEAGLFRVNGPNGVVVNRISEHAMRRLSEKNGCESADRVVRRILTLLANADEVFVKQEYRTIQLVNHAGEEARYFRSDGHVIVVVNGVIVTLHPGTANRWTTNPPGGGAE